jgi:hypothetical protein
MARKKSRPARPSQSSTAVAAAPPAPGIKAALPSARAVGQGVRREGTFLATPLGRFFHRTFRVFASLQLAISLLSFFTLSLILATLLESWHSGAIAQQLVYKTWWFTLLLFLLGTNILCAALKKMDLEKLRRGSWPWKNYQTGFLVTHLGLITLVFGGLLTALAGEDGQMVMIDTDDAAILRKAKGGGYTRTTNILRLSGEYVMDVYEVDANKPDSRLETVWQYIQAGRAVPDSLKDLVAGSWSVRFNPGHLPWHDEEAFRSNMPWYLRTLRNIASPVRRKSFDVGSATLEVTNFLPQTEYWPYSPAGDDASSDVFPALLLQLSGPMTQNQVVPMWATGSLKPEDNLLPLGGVFILLEDEALLPEFLDPPATKPGEGQLALLLGEGKKRVFRIPVGPDRLNEKVKVGDTGLTFELTLISNLRDLGARGHGKRSCPFVKFKLSRGDDATEFFSTAHHAGPCLALKGGTGPAEVSAWYRPADPLWGETGLRGVMQFLRTPGGKVYYRAYAADGSLRGKAQELDVSDTETKFRQPGKMPLSFQVGR